MSGDAALRRRALELSRSFIVQAPAGSGKTELLTQRFLKLLATVDRPERVLAITFTRKATQEMRERVLTRLRQAAAEEPLEQAHERLAVALAHDVLQRDREQQWQLLKSPARLRIHTIDGLCMQLLLRDPERGAVTAGLAVEEDARPLYREAVQRLLEDLGRPEDRGDATTDPAREALIRLLLHLDGDAQALQKLLVDMMGVRDQWTARIGTGADEIRQVLDDRQRAEMERFGAALDPAELEQAMALLAEFGAALDDRQAPPARFAEACAHDEEAGDEQALRLAHRFACVFLTAAGAARKPGGISRRMLPGLPDALAARIPELKALYADWCERGAAEAIVRMARTPPLDLGPGRSALREDIRQVVLQALAQLRVLFAEQGKTDFQYIAERALESLGEDELPGQVLLDEDQRLDHVLMDEFQDTSNTQFRLLQRLVAGWEPESGRSLFLVGDPMQSIYRFREANVGLFIDVVQNRRVGDVPLEFLQLESNFRSSSEIVDWVNTRFRDIFPREDRHDSGAVSYAPARSEAGPGGAVRLHPLAPESDDRDEARQAVEIVRQVRQELDDPRIAVLARARSHLGELARELNRQDIAFEAVRIDPLAARPEVQDLLALTRALEHPGDRIAWLALLRAPWCGLTIRQLHAVAGDDPREDLFERLGSVLGQGGPVLSRIVDDPASLQRLHAVMQRAIALRAARGLRERVEFCWRQLGGPWCCATPGGLDNAADFLDLLEAVEREGGEDLLGRLTTKLQELHARSQPAKLQLMTIHQAKGLEFDVVIIPGLHKVTRGNDKSLVALQEFRLADGRDGVLMAAMPPRGESEASVYAYLRAVDAERSDYEDQRTLYVAATRAKCQLHLLGRYGRRSSGELYAPGGSFLDMLMPAFLEVIEDVAPAEAKGRSSGAAVGAQALPLLRLCGDPPLPELPPLPEPVQPLRLQALPARNAVALGEALHLWLELIHDHWERGWDDTWFESREEALASTLRRFGAGEEAVPELLVELRRMLRLALSGETARAVVSPAGKAASWSELVLYEREDHGFSRHIVDRLYRAEDGRLVIADYKSGAEPPGGRARWIEQLHRYRKLVNELGAGEVAYTLIHHASADLVIDLSADSTDATGISSNGVDRG